MSRVKERITSKEETLVKPESRKYSQSESDVSCEEIDVESISPQKQKNETSRNESSNSDKSPIKSPVKKKKRKQDTANIITPRHAALKSTKHSSAFGVICGTCVIVVALFISILINYVSGGTSDNIKTNEELHYLQNQFLNNFHLLQKQFPGLSNRFWSVTGIPIQSVIYNPLSRQPAVIVIVNPPGKNNQGNQIATKLSQIYPAAKKPVFINSTEYRQEDPDLIKYHLDSLLSKGFNDGSKSAIIYQLEELPPTSTLIFYKYCDNENAPYKDVVIIFTVSIPDSLSDDYTTLRQEQIVEDFLRSKWEGQHDLDEDKISALFSRIFNSVAILNTEQNPNPII